MEILRPNIFGNEVIAGVTESNKDLFPEDGFDLRNPEHQSYLTNHLKLDKNQFIIQSQSHSDFIAEASEGVITKSDAIVTNSKNICLNVSIADCAGILLFDRVKKIIGAVHSGWRGTKQEILPKTINYLKKKYNSNPRDILFYISPLASVSNYEVGSEFKEYFPNTTFEKEEKLFFDNEQELITQIKQFDVPLINIESSLICTIESEFLQSFRRDGDKSGRMSAFIYII